MAFTWGGFSFGVDLNTVIAEALTLHADVKDFSHLAQGSASTQYALMARIVNDGIEEFLEANPRLGRKTATVTFVADTSVYDVSSTMSDLHGLAIERIEASDRRQLKYISPVEYKAFDPDVLNNDVVQDEPDYWTYLPDDRSLVLLPPPDAAGGTVTVYYREAPTAITSANVQNRVATPVSIGEIPTRFQRVLAQRIAVSLLEPINQEEADKMQVKYLMALENAKKVLNSVLATSQAVNQRSTRRSGPFVTSKPARY